MFEDAKNPKPESALVLNMAGVYKAQKGLKAEVFSYTIVYTCLESKK